MARARQIEAERLAAVNPSLRGMQLGDFEYVPDALRLGAQRGNRFEVTLRCARARAALACPPYVRKGARSVGCARRRP